MGMPDHLTCLLRNLHASQEATIRTGHRTLDWFQIGKGVHQGCILSPCLFNLHAEYIMRNARLDQSQARIKSARRSINNLRYADDTTLMSKTKEKLKSFLMRGKKDSEKVDLKLNIQKPNIMASSPTTLCKQKGKKWKQWQILSSWAPKSLGMVAATMKLKRHLLLGRKAKIKLDNVLKSRYKTCQQRSILSKLQFFQQSCMDVRVAP